MKYFKSIKWRLQAWHALVLVGVLAGFGVTAYQLERAEQFQRLDDEMERRVTMILAGLREAAPPMRRLELRDEFDGRLPGNDEEPERRPQRPEFALPQAVLSAFEGNQEYPMYFVLWRRDQTIGRKSTNAPGPIEKPVRRRESGPQGSRRRGDLRETYNFTPFGECALVGCSVLPLQARANRFALLLVGAGSAVLLFGLAGGWWLTSKAIRPIEEISATAGHISAGNLSERINVADTDSELGHLAGVLNSTFSRLEYSFEQQRQFTSDAAHELRTPVSVMVTQTQMALNRERSPEEYRQAIAACGRAAVRMRGLIESLLELARLDSGHHPMLSEKFDLARVVSECVEQARPFAAERQVQLSAGLALVECQADAGRIAQIVANLLNNAIHYNKEQGRVEVEVRAEGDNALVIVADTGAGIPAEDLPHIFKRFYRADKSRTKAQGRTGLGLAISQAIAETHGGKIEVTSQLGAGSTFTLRLPGAVVKS